VTFPAWSESVRLSFKENLLSAVLGIWTLGTFKLISEKEDKNDYRAYWYSCLIDLNLIPQ